jgi:hypothetical protein
MDKQMKKIVAIMTISLMLLASCGKTKTIINPDLKGDDVIGSEISGNSDLSKNKAPAPVKETFWGNYGAKICVAGSLVMVFAVLCLCYVKLVNLQYRTGQF